MSNWEGGTRVNAFVGGGALPEAARGTKSSALTTLWDSYATFCLLAGVDPTDERAHAAGLPPLDSHDMRPILHMGGSTHTREQVPIGDSDGTTTTVAGIVARINGTLWKLMTGSLSQSFWQGVKFPNASSAPGDPSFDCGTSPGCVFDLDADPNEHNDMGSTAPLTIVSELHRRLRVAQDSVFSPNRGDVDPAACLRATTTDGGFWGPWVDC